MELEPCKIWLISGAVSLSILGAAFNRTYSPAVESRSAVSLTSVSAITTSDKKDLWAAGLDDYGSTSSFSNFGSYKSRSAIRFYVDRAFAPRSVTSILSNSGSTVFTPYQAEIEQTDSITNENDTQNEANDQWADAVVDTNVSLGVALEHEEPLGEWVRMGDTTNLLYTQSNNELSEPKSWNVIDVNMRLADMGEIQNDVYNGQLAMSGELNENLQTLSNSMSTGLVNSYTYDSYKTGINGATEIDQLTANRNDTGFIPPNSAAAMAMASAGYSSSDYGKPSLARNLQIVAQMKYAGANQVPAQAQIQMATQFLAGASPAGQQAYAQQQYAQQYAQQQYNQQASVQETYQNQALAQQVYQQQMNLPYGGTITIYVGSNPEPSPSVPSGVTTYPRYNIRSLSSNSVRGYR